MIIVSCLSIGALGCFWIFSEYSISNSESKQLKKEYINQQKTLIKDEVLRTLNYINFKKASVKNKSKELEKIVQQETLDWINKIRFGKNGYIFVYSFDAVTLAHYKPGNIGINQWDFTDTNGVKVLQELIRLSQNEEGGFLEYVGTIRPTTGVPAHKISYAKSCPDWEWMVGAGVYVDDIEQILTQKQTILTKKIHHYLTNMILVLLISTLIILIISKFISKRIMQSVDIFLSFFKKAAVQSTKIVPQDIYFLEFKSLISPANQMIDQRIQAEKKLRESEKRFRYLTDASIEALFFTQNGICLDANLAAADMFGYDEPSEFIGLFGTEIIAPESRESVKEHMMKNLRESYETVGLRKDGTEFPIAIQAKQMTYKDKGIVRVSSIMDITKRRQAEEALLDSEEKYRTMMESMVDSAYIRSHDYRIEFMNTAMIKRIGYDAVGEICYKVMYGNNEKCAWCMANKVMDGESTNYELASPNDDKIYHVSNVPIFHADQSVSKLTVFRDITKLKAMEKQLRQAQKMEAIGTLAGGIAHDFNNILSPIVGYSEMLLEDIPDDSPYQEGLKQIYVSALRASKLVKQILTFSRQDSDALKMMRIQPVIKEAFKLIRSSIPTTINIKQNINPDCGVIKADPTQIHQIIMNLATNAFHAMEDTGGELTVSLQEVKIEELDLITPEMKPGVYACISVLDTGKGMDKKLSQKIFDPFFTTKEIGKGTGMGLSVVHGIVQGMNGSIQVYSRPDKGTEFYVYLPLAEVVKEKQTTNSEVSIQGGTEHIFLIDDEKPIIAMEQNLLKRLGYKVTSCSDSLEALEIFRAAADKFDLVITDMQMPALSGEKLSIELIKIRPDIPILLCTGFSASMSKEKAAYLGIKGFLLKPVVMKDLSSKIRKVLDSALHSSIPGMGQ